MNDKMTLYLAAPASTAEQACACGFPLALMAYKPGQGFHLYRTQLPDVRPELLYIDCSQFNGFGPHRLLGGEIMGECIARGARGIVLEIGSYTESVISFCSYLAHAARLNELTVYVPYSPGTCIEEAVCLVSSDVDEGSLAASLRAAIREYGAENTAIQVDRVFRDYPLPCRRGNWREPKNTSPQRLITAHDTQSFFSEDLCVRYFCYDGPDGTHMVLYDDAESVSEKLRTAKALGIRESFLYFPQAADLLDRLRGEYLSD